jgi:hypothetical protein
MRWAPFGKSQKAPYFYPQNRLLIGRADGCAGFKLSIGAGDNHRGRRTFGVNHQQFSNINREEQRFFSPFGIDLLLRLLVNIVELSGLHAVFIAFVDKGDHMFADEPVMLFSFNDFPFQTFGAFFQGDFRQAPVVWH